MTEPLRGYGAFYSLLTMIRSANVNELRNTASGVPARVTIEPGAIAWDNCDQCGLLASSVSRYFYTTHFPIEVTTTDLDNSGTTLAADLTIQIIRCAPQPADGDMAPSVSALEASAKQVMDDAFAVLCSTTTLLEGLRDSLMILDYLVRQQPVQGPAGACVGSELQVVVGISK